MRWLKRLFSRRPRIIPSPTEMRGFRVMTTGVWPDEQVWEPIDVAYGGGQCGYCPASGTCTACTGGVRNCVDPTLICVKR
jgi:hypothetical protein